MQTGQQLFELALNRGLLSGDRTRANYIGYYMYMGMDKADNALFKHYNTREYITLTIN